MSMNLAAYSGRLPNCREFWRTPAHCGNPAPKQSRRRRQLPRLSCLVPGSPGSALAQPTFEKCDGRAEVVVGRVPAASRCGFTVASMSPHAMHSETKRPSRIFDGGPSQPSDEIVTDIGRSLRCRCCVSQILDSNLDLLARSVEARRLFWVPRPPFRIGVRFVASPCWFADPAFSPSVLC